MPLIPLASLVALLSTAPVARLEDGAWSVTDSVGSCVVRGWLHARDSVASFQVHSPCDPDDSLVRRAEREAVLRLLEASGASPRRLFAGVDLFHSPTLMARWGAILKTSEAWERRPAKKHAWDTSEYPLVRRLMTDSGLFVAQARAVEPSGYRRCVVHIEKVSWQKAGEFAFYETHLRPAGWTRQERIPVPYMTTLECFREP